MSRNIKLLVPHFLLILNTGNMVMIIARSFVGFIVVVAVVGAAMFLSIGTAMSVYAQNTTMPPDTSSNKIKQLTHNR